MSINIQSETKIEAAKVYFLNSVDRQYVDEIFDKLHAQKRMKYIIQSTFHDYSIFVVWRTVFDPDELKKKNE